MNPNFFNPSLVVDALPKGFSFFHLGHVELQENGAETAADFEMGPGLGYALEGELRGWLLLLVDPALDLSMYSELGNIMASQLATRLGQEQKLDVMISPPTPLSEAQMGKLVRAQGQTAFRRTYLHLYREAAVRIEALLLVSINEGVGNA